MKVEVHRHEDGSINQDLDDERNFKTPAILRIYLEDKRSVAGMERPGPANLVEDLIWRRQVSYAGIAKDKSFQEQIKTLMTWLKFYQDRKFDEILESLHFGFSRYAGCSMCPCSPGIVVQFKDYSGLRFATNIWVTLSDDEKKEEAAENAAPALTESVIKAAGDPPWMM